MKILKEKIKKSELIKNFMTHFKNVIKDAELHSELEAYLIENGSKQENLWGINLYPFKDKENFIEYIALINIRPSQNNYSMEIGSEEIKKKIEKIVFELIEYES